MAPLCCFSAPTMVEEESTEKASLSEPKKQSMWKLIRGAAPWRSKKVAPVQAAEAVAAQPRSLSPWKAIFGDLENGHRRRRSPEYDLAALGKLAVVPPITEMEVRGSFHAPAEELQQQVGSLIKSHGDGVDNEMDCGGAEGEQNEIDLKAEEFIRRFYEQIRLQHLESARAKQSDD